MEQAVAWLAERGVEARPDPHGLVFRMKGRAWLLQPPERGGATWMATSDRGEPVLDGSALGVLRAIASLYAPPPPRRNHPKA